MFEKWKAKFIASQDAKTEAARQKPAETKRLEREAELELAEAARDYEDTVASGAKRLAETKARNDIEIKAKEEAIKQRQAEDKVEMERLRQEIADLDRQLEAYKNNPN
jgi:hypothetical protein